MKTRIKKVTEYRGREVIMERFYPQYKFLNIVWLCFSGMDIYKFCSSRFKREIPSYSYRSNYFYYKEYAELFCKYFSKYKYKKIEEIIEVKR